MSARVARHYLYSASVRHRDLGAFHLQRATRRLRLAGLPHAQHGQAPHLGRAAVQCRARLGRARARPLRLTRGTPGGPALPAGQVVPRVAQPPPCRVLAPVTSKSQFLPRSPACKATDLVWHSRPDDAAAKRYLVITPTRSDDAAVATLRDVLQAAESRAAPAFAPRAAPTTPEGAGYGGGGGGGSGGGGAGYGGGYGGGYGAYMSPGGWLRGGGGGRSTFETCTCTCTTCPCSTPSTCSTRAAAAPRGRSTALLRPHRRCQSAAGRAARVRPRPPRCTPRPRVTSSYHPHQAAAGSRRCRISRSSRHIWRRRRCRRV